MKAKYNKVKDTENKENLNEIKENNEITNKSKSKLIALKILIVIAVIALLTVFVYYNNTHLVITEYDYTNAKLPESIDGYCIVQISDLHNAKFGKDNEKLLEKIRICSPDIIVITGDMVDCSGHTNIPIALSFASAATDICPVYYITGNHEYYLSEEQRNTFLSGLMASGVIILNSESIELVEGVRLIGLDDNDLFHDFSNLIATEEFNIVLAHEPQRIKNYASSNADLVFSGHAHGGQIRLPIIGGLAAPDQGFNPEYSEGLIHYNNTDMIISRGLGNSAFPFRIFNYPEIVCVRFTK
ncbi:MAG: metallophosphoesterase [Lachnospiraceae bacterium]|nr:metallophosphoesterase [Lachnospiraceae bacterium]